MCSKCGGLMIEEVAIDYIDREPVVQLHCLNCGKRDFPTACCDTTHELREPGRAR